MENTESLKLWEKLAQISPDMLCTFDEHSLFVEISHACKNILGYNCEELIGRSCFDLIHPDYLAATLQAIQELRAGIKLKSFENCYHHKNGSNVYLHWSAAWSEEDKHFLCVARDITELKISRLKLEESEQRYKVLFDNIPDLVLVQNKEGLVTEVNLAFLDMVGMHEESIVGKSIASLLPPDMAALGEGYLAQVLKGSKIRFENAAKKDGKPMVLDTQMVPIMIGGKITGIQTIARDITSIVQASKTIRLQGEKLSSIFESITDAFIMIDRDWRLIYINREAERLVHFIKERDLGMNLWDVFPDQIEGDFHKQYQYAFETDQAINFTAHLHEYKLWLQVKAFPSPEGMSIYFDDVTKQVKAQKELEQLSMVASSTDNGVIITDPAGLIEWVNGGFMKMTGYTLPEVQGKKPGNLLQGVDTDEATIREMSANLMLKRPFNTQLINYRKSGETYWVSIDITPVYDDSGEIRQFISIQKDITGRKEAEANQLKMAKDLYKQNKDLQQFTYIVSHNLRAPVANVLGLADLITRIDKDSKFYSDSLLNLKLSAQNIDTVLRDLNTILSIRDKKGNLEMEAVNVKLKLQQAISSLQERLHHCGGKVNIEMEEDLQVSANRSYLYSIFHNLLSNAIKYRSKERALQVQIMCFCASDREITISFADNGSGFDMNKAQDKVFKLYNSFHPEIDGRGIGLYLVKEHIEAMDGHIEVDSEVEVGTKFLINLHKA